MRRSLSLKQKAKKTKKEFYSKTDLMDIQAIRGWTLFFLFYS
jgi:hypothetical protein